MLGGLVDYGSDSEPESPARGVKEQTPPRRVPGIVSLVAFDRQADAATGRDLAADGAGAGQRAFASAAVTFSEADVAAAATAAPSVPTPMHLVRRAFPHMSPLHVSDRLPAETTDPCPPALQAKVAERLELQVQEGMTFTEMIRSKKQFGNPDLLQKIVSHFNIRDSASNYPQGLFDPAALPEDAFYDALAARQRRAEARRVEALEEMRSKLGPS